MVVDNPAELRERPPGGKNASPVAKVKASTLSWEERIDRALSAPDGLAMVYQPIADINRGVVAGYEALARFSDVGEETPDQWFRSAVDATLVAKLDARVAKLALEHRSALAPGRFVTINAEPSSFGSKELDKVLLGCPSLDGVVIEITEHQKIGDHRQVLQCLGRYKDRGALIALDDTGAGYAGLSQILKLRPSILKLDRELVAGIDHDEARAALVEMIRVFANRIDAKVLAEGVETQSEATALRRLDIPLAQGYFFGRPAAGFGGLESRAITTCARFPSPARRSQLDKLVELTACLQHSPDLDYEIFFRTQPELERIVVLDSRHRPCGVVVRGSRQPDPLRAILTVNRFESISEVARRMLTRDESERFAPVVCVNGSGRYLGTISAARIFSELADGYQSSQHATPR